jgi:enamine deaminase RidA (YjgF/YER057c/UK114 family)
MGESDLGEIKTMMRMKRSRSRDALLALPLLFSCAPPPPQPTAAEEPPTERKFHNTGAKPNGYTHTVAVSSPGAMVFVSGAAGAGPDGKMPEDFATQCDNTFKSLGERLALAGAGFDDVVKINYFMSPEADLNVLREVRARYLNMDNPPAASAIPAPFQAPMMLEVEAIAILDRSDRSRAR